MKSNYEERKENRINRYRELSAKNHDAAQALGMRSSNMAAQIPFGQPTLIGHHSEGRDRRFRAKIHNTMEKSVRASEKSEYYAEKAAAAERNHSISSDNPNAIPLLKEKIAKLEQLQDEMKKANKLVKKNDIDGLRKLGYGEKKINELTNPQFYSRPGYPAFALSNNRQNITAAKKRLATLEKQATESTTVISYDDLGLKVIDNVEENRLQIYFAEKPSEAVREKLNAWGFKYSRSLVCWQRHRSMNANYAAKNVIEFMRKI